MPPEFDRYSSSYEALLKHPIREFFSPPGSDFLHRRKRDLILDYFRRRRTETRQLAYLDVGCGKGDLACLLRGDFASVAACDPSPGMLNAGGLSSHGIRVRVQDDPNRIPFDGAEFDFVTAVCVYHHVPPPARPGLLREMARVVKPGGALAILEHNPYNPATRCIVGATPLDAGAILLRPSQTRRLFREAGLTIADQRYFLYFPEFLYRRLGRLESLLERIPLGGQYAVFAGAP